MKMNLKKNLMMSRKASYVLAGLSGDKKNEVLVKFAQLILENANEILKQNAKDLKLQKNQLSSALYDRLKLDAAKLKQLAQGVRDMTDLPDPVGKVLQKTVLDNGLVLEKQTVPLGVLGIVFESRPDVIPQILSLALKSGNAVILKGGKEATYSNRAFMKIALELNKAFSWLPKGWVQLLESREAFRQILAYPEYVDLIIPRGSNELVRTIQKSTQIPVLGHAEGVCHLYIHEAAELSKALEIAIDSKTQYPSACNSLETLLVDQKIAKKFLPSFASASERAQVKLKGCPKTRKILPKIQRASEKDWRTEYCDLTLSICVVESLVQAIDHINSYGSHHTDAIVTEDPSVQEQFLNEVDSANVFVNASTRFADGFRYGFGAEVGISTNKTHARGPVGLEGLVIYKYKLRGNGHVVKTYVGTGAKPFLHKRENVNS